MRGFYKSSVALGSRRISVRAAAGFQAGVEFTAMQPKGGRGRRGGGGGRGGRGGGRVGGGEGGGGEGGRGGGQGAGAENAQRTTTKQAPETIVHMVFWDLIP